MAKDLQKKNSGNFDENEEKDTLQIHT